MNVLFARRSLGYLTQTSSSLYNVIDRCFAYVSISAQIHLASSDLRVLIHDLLTVEVLLLDEGL